MEYRRSRALSRRSTSRGARASALSVFIFLLTCGIIVFIFCTSQAAEWIVEHVFSPILSESDNSREEVISALTNTDKITPSPTAAVSTAPTMASITETLNQDNYFFLQMGCYEDEETANDKALSIRAMGAAGYVYYDGALYRVLAACYGNPEELTKVQDQIRRDGYDNTAYILRSDAVTMTISGKETDVSAIRNAGKWLQSLPDQMTEYVIVFDRDGLSLQDGLRKAEDWLNETHALLEQVEKLKIQESVMPIVSALRDYHGYLSTFVGLDATMDTVSFSAELKKLQIQTIVRLCEMTGKDISEE